MDSTCYHSVHILLRSVRISKTVKMRHKTPSFTCCFLWVKNLIPHPRKEHRLTAPISE